jgi:DNA-binding NarL/FixJ family response regulator
VITVVLVDDQEVIRVGLRAILSDRPDIEVVGEVGDGLSAVRIVAELSPDVVLMDLRMPGIDGVEATRRIRTGHPEQVVRILVLTTFDQDANVLAALRAGADGFLSKGASPAELVDGILRVARGEHALSGSAVNAVVAHVSVTPGISVDAEAARLVDELTAREREVVTYLVQGLTNREIAEALCLSPLTVKTHVNHAMVKLGARDRAQLVTVAVRAGILPTT